MENKVEHKTLSHYFIKNKEGVAFSLDTRLKRKEPGKERFKLTIPVPGEKKEFRLLDQFGYTAKEIYESPGVKRHVDKGYILVREQKVSYKVTTPSS